DKAEANIGKIVKNLQNHQVQLMKDSAMLDKLYDLNLTYFKELTMYILAGKKRLAEVRQGELVQLIEKAKQTGRAEDAQAAQDLENMCQRFEKKISDLELTRTIALQTAPQIRLVQSGEMTMIEKIQTTLVNTIPLWKSQMVISLGMQHAEEALKAQKSVTDMTNDLLRSNAERLKMGTIETAKEAERGVIDLESIRVANTSLIETLTEVQKIQREGAQKRAEASIELGRLEKQLRDKVLEINSK
ncbi:MAG: toxic anion resistance protein, partial [Candidatus Ventricola sp.]|nr:toxic anion resistance protein [Candidatus Ventricola sp.]